jgi:hypothetical protein
MDSTEVEVDEGPCVDATTDDACQHDKDLTVGETPWSLSGSKGSRRPLSVRQSPSG